MIEGLCASLPKKKLYKLIMANVQTLIQENEESQYVGYLILQRIIEGCAEQIRHDLSNIIKSLLTGFRSSNAMIQSAAIFCASNLASFLNPEIFTYHQALLPPLIQALSS